MMYLLLGRRGSVCVFFFLSFRVFVTLAVGQDIDIGRTALTNASLVQLSNLFERAKVNMPKSYHIRGYIEVYFPAWTEADAEAEAEKQTKIFEEADKSLTSQERKKQFIELKQSLMQEMDGSRFFRIEEWRSGDRLRIDQREGSERTNVFASGVYDSTDVSLGVSAGSFRINRLLASALKSDQDAHLDSNFGAVFELDKRIRLTLLLLLSGKPSIQPGFFGEGAEFSEEKAISISRDQHPKTSIQYEAVNQRGNEVDRFLLKNKSSNSDIQMEVVCKRDNYKQVLFTRISLPNGSEHLSEYFDYGSSELPRKVVLRESKNGTLVREQVLNIEDFEEVAVQADLFNFNVGNNYTIEVQSNGVRRLVQVPVDSRLNIDDYAGRSRGERLERRSYLIRILLAVSIASLILVLYQWQRSKFKADDRK